MRVRASITLVVAVTLNVSAQTAIYRPGTFDSAKAVEQVLDNLKLKTGSSEILTYKEAWSEALGQYEKSRGTKPSFDKGDLDRQRKAVDDEQAKYDRLEGEKRALQAQLDSLGGVLADLKVETAKMAGTTVTVGEADATLVSQIDRDNVTVGDNSRRIDELDAEIARLESEVEARRQLNDKKRSSNESAAESVEASKSSWSSVIEEVAEALAKGKKELSRPIEECDVAAVESAIATYEKRRNSIATIDPTRCEKLDGEVAAMKERLMVIRPVSDAIVLMGQRYNKKSNEKMATTLQKSMDTNKRLMTSADIEVYKSIIEALNREDNAYRNLTYLMGELSKQVPTTQTAVKAKVAEVVSYINPGADRYNAYYTRLNNALQMIENADSLTQKDIEKIKSDI